jgi:hypothetical protein
MGSGMALPWSIFSTASLANGNIVEDLHLGLELAQRGRAPQFCEDALVTSGFPVRKEAQLAQLTRWEHGHLATIASHLPRLLWRSVLERNGNLAAMALDLGVPPLALLALALGAIAAVAAALTLVGASPWPALVATAGLFMLAAAVLASWWGYGRAIVSLTELMMAPTYGVAKVPMYVRFILACQTQWIRTDRDKDGDRDRTGRAGPPERR